MILLDLRETDILWKSIVEMFSQKCIKVWHNIMSITLEYYRRCDVAKFWFDWPFFAHLAVIYSY